MANEKKFGVCHICGFETALTFEHVPPRAALNDRPLVGAHLAKLIGDVSLEMHDKPKGPIFQKGGGAYTLCDKCNNNSGVWYGNAFVDWAYQGLQLSQHATVAPSLYHIFRIFPLRVLKQIICMFFSTNGSNFQKIHPDLVRFVLNRDEMHLKPKVKIYTYFNISPRSRQTGMVGLLNLNARSFSLFSEIAFPPFGYVMAIDSAPHDDRLVEISFFSHCRYNDWKDISLRLPIFPIYTYLPGDYRDREAVSDHLSRYVPGRSDSTI